MPYFWLNSYKDIVSSDNIFYSFEVLDRNELVSEILGNSEYVWDILDRNNLPSGCGVYVFVVTDSNTNKKEIAYIGCSKNLQIRLYSHYILRFLAEMLECHLLVEIFIFKTMEYKLIEENLITKVRPFLNRTVKPAKIRIENDKRKRKMAGSQKLKYV